MIAGLAGDSGKTFVSLGLIMGFSSRGMKVAPFKKGPDFIDAAWLSAAAGLPGRNLDTFLMPEKKIIQSLAHAGTYADCAVIEGNRGLFDGLDERGSHSTARLAELTKSPVVLVLNTTKSTRTLAAMVLGCQAMDSQLDLAGVILNQVGTFRQEKVIRRAMAVECDIPVVGAIPRLKSHRLPSRHMGLLTACEHEDRDASLAAVGQVVSENVDWAALEKIAGSAPELPCTEKEPHKKKPCVRMGLLKDNAFSFYYPENLEALEAQGARLIPISPLADEQFPDVDALYAGGGFPEVYAEALSGNPRFRESLAKAMAQGLPVMAECGGLMYLAEGLIKEGRNYPMVGALPILVEQGPTPRGHGYVQAKVDKKNAFWDCGQKIRGHEFHYSKLVDDGRFKETIMDMERGVGVGQGRDGMVVGNTLATYTHLHASGWPGWAPAFLRAAGGAA
jgi:cobyrinic acid a,c-diamide synthase